jgi:hypothetical protein
MLKQNINLIVKLLLIVFLVVLLVIIYKIAEANTTELEANKTQTRSVKNVLIESPVRYSDIDYTIYYDPDTTEEHIVKIQGYIKELENLNKDDYTQKAYKETRAELARLKEIEARMYSDLEQYLAWESEYYYATKVWEYLMQRGYGRTVTSAILGNMMIETSGGSLALNPTIYSYSGNYYGLCQWSKKYYPEAHGLSFEQQLEFLLNNIEWEINTFGKCYKEGFKYEDFINMTDHSEAALAFAKSYERCGPASYKMRQEAALKAYEYFDLDR